MVVDTAKIRAWWAHRQGLDGSLRGKSPSEVLRQSGWARSVGGVGPYLTLFARAGTSREEADRAAAKLEIHELPAARGCTYVVPAADFAIALKAGQQFAGAEMRVAARIGVTEKEIDKLCDAVMKALAKGPLDPEGMREATGKASRSLGEEGKKKGLTTTLPIAIGLLQSGGEIRRVPVNGRFDQQRYAYALWTPNPLDAYRGSAEDALQDLARRFFRWVGPATLGEFQWFAGIGVKAARETTGPLHLVPVEAGSDRLLLPEYADSFRAFKTPAKPLYVLVSSLDAISAARRDVKTLVDEKDLQRKVVSDSAAAPVGGLSDLPSHAILDRGRLCGLWEYDFDARAIAWSTFHKEDKSLLAAVKETEAYVRDQLGDARSFSLDSPRSRAPRVQALREMQASSR